MAPSWALSPAHALECAAVERLHVSALTLCPRVVWMTTWLAFPCRTSMKRLHDHLHDLLAQVRGEARMAEWSPRGIRKDSGGGDRSRVSSPVLSLIRVRVWILGKIINFHLDLTQSVPLLLFSFHFSAPKLDLYPRDLALIPMIET
jgi:hypothetical protein